MSRKILKNHQGFALTELLVVAAIIGILALIAFPFLWERRMRTMQVSTYQTMRMLMHYQAMVFSKCQQITSGAFGITKNGCNAQIVWTPPPDCGKIPQLWPGPPDFGQNSLDGNNYGYFIHFPEDEGPEGGVPVIGEALKDLDNDTINDRIWGTTNTSIYHKANDVDNSGYPIPDGMFVPSKRRQFNLCADPILDNPASDPDTNPKWF